MKWIKKHSKYIAAFIFCVAVIAVYRLFDDIGGITRYVGIVVEALKPFITAFVIAYVLNMPAVRLERLMKRSKNDFVSKRARGLSILIVYLVGVIVVILALSVLVPALYRNIIDMYNNFPMYVNSIINKLNNMPFIQHLDLRQFDAGKLLERFFGTFDMSQLGTYAQGVFNVTGGVFDGVVAVIASIYMLLDKERLQRLVVRILGSFLSEKALKSAVDHAKRWNGIFTNYIYARLVCCIVMAIVCSIVLTLMGVKYSLLLGLFIGAMDMIPYFGSIIACVVVILVALITGGFWNGLWVAVVLIVLQQLDGNILGPKVMGDSLEIRPIWVIFAVSVGGALFGFVGMLISVPVIAIIRVLLSDYITAREKKREAKREESNADVA